LLVAISASAICGVVSFAWKYWQFILLAEEQKKNTPPPIVPIDVLVIGTLAILWMAIWAIVGFWQEPTSSPVPVIEENEKPTPKRGASRRKD